MKLLMIDNYDSFTYNLVQYLGEMGADVHTVRNDRATVDELLAALDRNNLALAVDIASVPEQIRGYGHIKHAHLEKAQARREQLLSAWRNPQAAKAAA